jgi:hypothetical protein
MQEEWLSIAEAAREFAASESTIRRLQDELQARIESRGGRSVTVVNRLKCDKLFFSRSDTASQLFAGRKRRERDLAPAAKWLASSTMAGVVGGAAYDAVLHFAHDLLTSVFGSGVVPVTLADAIVHYDEHFFPPARTMREYLSKASEVIVGLDGTAEERLTTWYSGRTED